MHGVGIMALNTPYWFISSLGAIFSGGLSCGIYTTNSAASVKYICEHAPLDILILQNYELLEQILKKEPKINDIVKHFVIIENDLNTSGYENISTWDEMIINGQNIDNDILKRIEDQQAVNQACLLVYTSGTTGPPKGKVYFVYLWNYQRLDWTMLFFKCKNSPFSILSPLLNQKILISNNLLIAHTLQPFLKSGIYINIPLN